MSTAWVSAQTRPGRISMSEKSLVLCGKEKRRETISKDISILAEKDSDSILILTLKKEGELNISLDLEENARLTIFYNNQSPHLLIREEARVGKNASLKAGYSELESGESEREAFYRLTDEGAEAEVIGGLLCTDNVRQNVRLIHEAKNTSSNISMHCLVLTGGNYGSEIIGRIEKGAKGAKAHQTTRVLTFAEKERCQVLPVLEIEDNDVEASHALSIGQLDEMQLYYLQTRGLNEKEALRLLATGYLMPLASVADDADLRQELTALIERKVAEVCSM